jgi:hypothetical protein
MRTSTPSQGRPAVVATSSNESPGRDSVTLPASVSPYPVISVWNGSSLCIRRTSSTGMSAAPVTPASKVDSLDLSRIVGNGW